MTAGTAEDGWSKLAKALAVTVAVVIAFMVLRSNGLWFTLGIAIALAMFGCLVLMVYGQNSLVAG